MKKQLFVMCILFCILVSVVSAGISNQDELQVKRAGFHEGSFAGGSGTEDDPYQIEDVHQLQNISLDLGAHYELIDDIDASETSEWNDGAGFEPIGNKSAQFTGIFNGNDFSIEELYINRTEDDYVGLFSSIDKEANIESVFLNDSNISGNRYVGSIAGRSDGTISSVGVQGDLNATGRYVGGLVGFNNESVIFDSYYIGDIAGYNSYVGGIVGLNSGLINYTHANGNMYGTNDLGGLVGVNKGTVRSSSTNAEVSGRSRVGLLIGANSGFIQDSYSLGDVNGTSNSIGGLLGSNDGSLYNSYYNIDDVTINGGHHITVGGLFEEQFLDWLNNDLSLDIADYGDTLAPNQDHYEIENVDGLRNMLGFSTEGYKFKMTSDIDLSENPGLYIPRFSGVFHGNGHTISNLFVDLQFGSNIGLFGIVETGSIKNITMIDTNLTGRGPAGGLIGINHGVVENAHSSGNLSSSQDLGGLVGNNEGLIKESSVNDTDLMGGFFYTGGLVGRNSGQIEKCFTNITIADGLYTGGITGYNTGIISSSYTYANMDGGHSAGGLVGLNRNGVINNSYALGNVTGIIKAGGLVSENSGLISNSYASGDVVVSGDYTPVGGLVGINSDTIENSYSTGNVMGTTRVGGLVGSNSGSVKESYSYGDVEGEANVGGLIGRNHASAGTIKNSHYNIDQVLINGEHHITIGGLFKDQYYDWFSNDKKLNIQDYDETLNHDGYHYEISCEDGLRDLLGFAGNDSFSFQLENDIDLSSTPGLYIPYFRAKFNGNNNTIYSLEIDLPFASHIGLFGNIMDGVVKNTVIKGCNIVGYSYVGALAGHNTGTVMNSYTHGNVNGTSYLGGLVGVNRGTIQNSHVTVDLISSGRCGGLVGWNRGYLNDTSSEGNVTVTEFFQAGGHVGINSGHIQNSYSIGDVNGSNSYTGGFIGYNSGTIFNSYAYGDVIGKDYVGGLVAYNIGTISHSYTIGGVYGDSSVGGLVGYHRDAPIRYSYSTGAVQGNSSVGGFVGSIDDGEDFEDTANFWDEESSGQNTSAMGVGKSTDEMMEQSTYTSEGWDFLDTWWMVEDQTYPFLWWQSVSVDITSPEEGQLFTTRNVTVRWSACDGNTGLGIDSYEYRLNQGDWIDADYATNCTIEGLEDGIHTIEVKAYDTAGNHAVDSKSFIVDVTGPVINITYPYPDEAISSTDVKVEWTAFDEVTGVDRYEIRLNNGTWINKSTETSHRFVDLEEGEHTVYVRAYDNVGNSAVKDVTFMMDRSDPMIDIVHPIQEEMIPSNNVTVQWNGTPINSDISHYEIRIDEGEWVNKGSNDSYTFVGLEEGTYIVEVKVYDIAGNSARENITFTVNTTAPQITHDAPSRHHMEDDMVVEVVITSSYNIENVTLNYWYNGLMGNISMNRTAGDTFTATIPATGQECVLEYQIQAVDSVDQISWSTEYTIPILDLAPPTVDICHDGTATRLALNGTLNASFSKPIDSAKNAVTIQPAASLELNWTDAKNLTINLINLTPDTEYTLTFTNSDIKDIHGIHLEGNNSFDFVTQGYPRLSPINVVEEWDKSSEVTVETELASDVEPSNVTLFYNDTHGVLHEVSANQSDETTWTAVIPRQNHSGVLQYWFEATDISGLTDKSTVSNINITNPLNVDMPSSVDAEADTPFDYTVTLTNPVGVMEVVMHYTTPSGVQQSKDLILREGDPGSGIWECTLNVEEGEMIYHLEVIDIDGETTILPGTINVSESSSLFGGMLFYLILLLVICAVGSGIFILWKGRKKEEDELLPPPPEPEETVQQEASEPIDQDRCTICYGQLSDPSTRCTCEGCGRVYHPSCLTQLSECPVCGRVHDDSSA